MKGLTLHQPWAWCVAHDGKDVENRSWLPPDSIIYQRIAIHAGLKYDKNAARIITENLLCELPEPPAPYDAGAIVATTVVTAVATWWSSKWFAGPFGWLLERTIALPGPIPCKGRQGLWNVPHDIEHEIIKQIGGHCDY